SLKRHIEKVVKKEIDELRREVKKIRTNTETEKSNDVAKYGSAQNQVKMKYKDTSWMNVRHSKYYQKNKLHVEDTSSTSLLNTRKPGFVFIQKGKHLDPLNVVAVGENKKSKNFKSADIGHAVAFAEKVHQLQQRRQRENAGVLECMSDNVLQSLVNDKPINYEPMIDLVCLIRSMLHQPLLIERISFDWVPRNSKERVQNIWPVNGRSVLWSKIRSNAENSNYDDEL
ncbi:8577_t:CDS:2, partial [Ambispora leptoticha]